ncbi:hypothetical protein FRC08_011395 [Ceratobasidium sp. 394]|nr:hypothetical protein FRC08_011395 [Ceratobasidium sp. 394]
MSRDENVYKEAETFNPDRFPDPKVPPLPIFGWGWRKCPDNNYGKASVFISIASLLATFTFSKKRDKDGQETMPMIEAAGNALALYIPETLTVVIETLIWVQ